MTFREAKQIIRGALAEVGDAKLIEVLEAARAGELPWISLCRCVCLATVLYGPFVSCFARDPLRDPVSDAYGYLGWSKTIIDWSQSRQRILIPMVLSEIRQRERSREVARAIVDEAVECATIAEFIGGGL